MTENDEKVESVLKRNQEKEKEKEKERERERCKRRINKPKYNSKMGV